MAQLVITDIDWNSGLPTDGGIWREVIPVDDFGDACAALWLDLLATSTLSFAERVMRSFRASGGTCAVRNGDRASDGFTFRYCATDRF